MPKKKEAPFKMNKDGYYRTTFTVIDALGNKKRIPLRDKDPYALERKLMEKKFEYEKGLLVVNGNSTVEKWALEWLDTYKKNKIIEKSYKRYKTAITNYIVPKIGSIQLKDVKAFHIQNFLSELTNMSNYYIGFIYNALNSMFSKAVANDMILKNPCLGVEKPKGKLPVKRRALTPYEEDIFLKTAAKHHRGTMFKLILKCGLRPEEVRALDVRNFDFKNNKIIVSNAVESGTTNIKETKSESGERNVAIPLDFVSELKSVLPDKGLAFPSYATGKVMTEKNFYRSWDSFMRLMNIEAGAKLYRNAVIDKLIDENITPYYLRHTYCTHLAEKGIDMRVAQYLMGHSDITVTANIYTHVNPDMLKNVSKTMSATNVPKRKIKCKNLSKFKALAN